MNADDPTVPVPDYCRKCGALTHRTDRLCAAHHEDAEILSQRIRSAS